MRPTVNTIRLRSSGTFPMLAKAERADIATRRSASGGRRGHGTRRSTAGGRTDDERFAARLGDLGGRRLGERVGRDGDGLGDLAVAEDLDAVVAALDEALGGERLRVDLRARAERVEVAHVDLGGDGRTRIGEAALRKAALPGGLAAFEGRLETPTPAAPPLLPAAGRLSPPRAAPPTEALLRGGRPRGLGKLGESIRHGPPPRRSPATALSGWRRGTTACWRRRPTSRGREGRGP